MKVMLVKTCGICCIFWHRWVLIKDNGFTKYSECKDCLARKAEQPKGGGYQPIHMLWLSKNADEEEL